MLGESFKVHGRNWAEPLADLDRDSIYFQEAPTTLPP